MNNTITIREYYEEDAPFLAAIYFNTVHSVNTRDYSLEQVNVWAPLTSLETAGWIKKWQKCSPIVATINNKVVGFVELENNGHIDCFYCHHEHQGCGVGSALMNKVEKKALENNIKKLFAEVSITAKSFFEAKGFKTIKEQTIERKGVFLTNFIMEKYLDIIN